MKEFLNKAMLENQTGKTKDAESFAAAFSDVCAVAVRELGDKPFHIRGGRLNVSALDSVLATMISHKHKLHKKLAERYSELLKDAKYDAATFYGTSDVSVVKERFEAAKRYLVA